MSYSFTPAVQACILTFDGRQRNIGLLNPSEDDGPRDSSKPHRSVIALPLVVAGTSFYKRDYRDAILCFLVATLFGFVFFRKRKGVLVVSGFSCILALGGLGFPFHPSFPGFVLLLGSAAALYLTIRWRCKKISVHFF